MSNSSTFVMDDESEKELEELSDIENKSKSEIVRESIKDRYLKEKRAQNNLNLFIDLYNEETITKDMLFLLLPEKDAESVIIGSKTGKEAAKVVKEIDH